MKPNDLTNRAVILRDNRTNHKVNGTADSVEEANGKLIVTVTLDKDSEVETAPKKRTSKKALLSLIDNNEDTDSES